MRADENKKGKHAKPKSILQAERENKSVYSRNVLSFSVGIQFRVMKLSLLAVMRLHGKRYGMLALSISNLLQPSITMRSIS